MECRVMDVFDGPFGEALKEMGIPREHSLFAAAYGKNGFNIMLLNEAVSHAGQGRNLPWFYKELKRRYENIYYFFRGP